MQAQLRIKTSRKKFKQPWHFDQQANELCLKQIRFMHCTWLFFPLYACCLLIKKKFLRSYIFCVIALIFFAGQTCNSVIYTARVLNKHIHMSVTLTQSLVQNYFEIILTVLNWAYPTNNVCVFRVISLWRYSAFIVIYVSCLIGHMCNLVVHLNAMISLVSERVNLTSDSTPRYVKEEAYLLQLTNKFFKR